MATRLKNIKFDEVSFVKRGANQHADVVLFKSDMGGMEVPDPSMCDHESCDDSTNYCPDCGIDAHSIMGYDEDISEGEDHENSESEGYESSEDNGGGNSPAINLNLYVQKDDQDVERLSTSPTTRRTTVLSKSDLPDSLAAYIEGDLDTPVTEETFLKGVVELATDILGDDFTPVEQDALAKADPEIRDIVAKAHAEAEQAVAIARNEQDLRLTAEYVSKASEFRHLPVNAEEFGPVLKRLSDYSPHDYAVVEGLLKAADRGMAGLFKAAGQEAPSSHEGSSLSAIEKAASAVQAEQPSLTPEQAYDLALRRNPSLYTDSLEN